MQQDHQHPTQTIRRPTRLVKYAIPAPIIGENKSTGLDDSTDIAVQPTALMEPISMAEASAATTIPRGEPTAWYSSGCARLSHADADLPEDISSQQTHLMQLSGMMRAIRIAPSQDAGPHQDTRKGPHHSLPHSRPYATLDDVPKDLLLKGPYGTAVPNNAGGFGVIEEEYWPNGIQQTGPLPIVNLYGSEPFGRTLPLAAIPTTQQVQGKQQTAWKSWLNTPVVKVTIGLLIGIGLLYLDSKFVNIAATIQVLQQNLTTARGITLALLSGVAFLTAFSVRGIRWKLFLNPIGKISIFKAVQLFLVGIFLNFLLPVRGGEVAKSLMLKRIAGIPVSKSLPTVAMDKALDLMPALIIMAIVPFLGITMDIKLWLILGTVGGLLVGLIFFTGLTAWKRTAAIVLLHTMTGILPKAIGDKIAGFATGFVDSLLLAASRPSIFLPAVLLTCVAVIFDGLFAMLAFWTIGFPISFGTAIFGYTVYNMFYILPTPPGQVGSNEVAGMLVFNGLLGLSAEKVTAMFVFSHPWAALLMSTIGMICLSALGLTISSAMKVQTLGD